MKKNLKKICLILVLMVIVAGIAFVAGSASQGKREQIVNTKSATVDKVAQGDSDDSTSVATTENTTAQEGQEGEGGLATTAPLEKEKKEATQTTLKDGVEYSVTDKAIKADIVLKDNYFDTQILDFNTNFDQYEGKTVEIEGLYFENGQYTFVGRYSTSNICPYCPTGYSYFEYEWNGDKKPELVDSESWIKVVGTLRKGNDGVEYYYIDSATLELMNEKGQDTVSN